MQCIMQCAMRYAMHYGANTRTCRPRCRMHYTVHYTAHHTMHFAACTSCRAQGWLRLPPSLRLLRRQLHPSRLPPAP